MGTRQWIEEALRLHFDEKLSRMAISHRLNVSDSTLYEFFQRFRKYNLPWPLPDGVTLSRLEQRLYPGKQAKKSRTQRPEGGYKSRRPNFPEEFKRHLVELSTQSDMSVAQLARKHGINDNLLFNWRRRYLHKQNKNTPDTPVTLMPVEVVGPQESIIDVVPERSAPAIAENELCCEMVLPGGTLKLSGTITPALLQTLLDGLKGASQ